MRAWSTSFKIIQKYLFRILVFLLPIQLAFHFWPSWSFVYGIRIDYFAPAIYVQDLIIAIFFIIFLLTNAKLRFPFSKVLIFFLFLIFILTNIHESLVWQVSLLKWVRILELIFLGFSIRFANLDFQKDFVKPLSFSVILFTFIGILQFVLQKSIGGPLYLFGERSFSLDTPGIAKVVILGKNYLRAYSTFSHPNSFAGFLLIALSMFCLSEFRSREKALRNIAILFSLIGILISFSLGIYILTSVFILFLTLKKYVKLTFDRVLMLATTSLIVSLVLPLVSLVFIGNDLGESLSQRLFLADISEKIIQTHFLLGVGANNFIIALSQFRSLSNSIWLLQPVHNIFLLIFTETGIAGLILFFLLLIQSLKKGLQTNQSFLVVAILLICFSGIFDHYWLTLIQNQLLLTILISFTFKFPKAQHQNSKKL